MPWFVPGPGKFDLHLKQLKVTLLALYQCICLILPHHLLIIKHVKMKRIVIFLAGLSILAACNNSNEKTAEKKVKYSDLANDYLKGGY